MSTTPRTRVRAGGVRPQAGSVTDRLLNYFTANPDEELTPEDAALKLGATTQAIHNATHRLAQGKQLESVRIIRVPAIAKGRA